MKYKVLISNLAKKDIIDIRTYIDFKLSSSKASQKLYLLIKSKIKMLEDNPFIYKEEIVLKKSQARIRKIK